MTQSIKENSYVRTPFGVGKVISLDDDIAYVQMKFNSSDNKFNDLLEFEIDKLMPINFQEYEASLI